MTVKQSFETGTALEARVQRLFMCQGAFAERGLNMSKIESRPSRRRPWEYVFFVDIDGHERDEAVAAALADLRASCETLKVLGSYPRADAPAPAAASAESQTAPAGGKRP